MPSDVPLHIPHDQFLRPMHVAPREAITPAGEGAAHVEGARRVLGGAFKHLLPFQEYKIHTFEVLIE